MPISWFTHIIIFYFNPLLLRPLPRQISAENRLEDDVNRTCFAVLQCYPCNISSVGQTHILQFSLPLTAKVILKSSAFVQITPLTLDVQVSPGFEGYSRLGCQMGVPSMPEFALFQEGVVGFASWDKTEFADLCLDSQNTLLPNAS